MSESKMKIVALVPMRHHSQRVPEKNFRLLAGKPLYHHIIHSLLDVAVLNEIVVDTDSPIIMSGLKEDFPEVRILERPIHLRDDNIPMNEILHYDVSQVRADIYLQTHSTNPLLRATTISQGVQQFLKNFPNFDTLFSVTRMQTRLWDQLGRAINHNPDILLRTQDLPPVYEENSCLYIFSGKTLLQRHNRIGERPMMFEIDPEEALDIDEEIDFLIADILKQRQVL